MTKTNNKTAKEYEEKEKCVIAYEKDVGKVERDRVRGMRKIRESKEG